jgi:hypothetical protein
LIRHLQHHEIDRQQWDSCIALSVNSLPYAFAWWLDAACPFWEAIVDDDYRAVMPLPAARRFGFDYIYQPYFTQQLGIFSQTDLTTEDANRFLRAIPVKYRYIYLHLNATNNPSDHSFTLAARNNHVLDISLPALQLYNQYHRNCRRNIQKAVHARLTVKPGPGPSVFVRFIKQNLERNLKGIKRNFYPVLLRLTAASILNRTGEIAGVYNPAGELLAAGWFVTVPGRCLFLVCASTPKGKENHAMYLLVNHMISDKAGAGLVFDFAGSNIPGVAYFNNGFGSDTTTYLSVQRNQLPWPFRLFKE